MLVEIDRREGVNRPRFSEDKLAQVRPAVSGF